MSDLCKCGHDARHHAFGKCNAHACCGNEKCDTTFLTNPDAPPADRDDLAALLDKHQRWTAGWTEYGMCICGERFPREGFRSDINRAHSAHVAQMVLESDWLRERDDEKWREGRRSHAHRSPYRADRVDAEDGGGE